MLDSAEVPPFVTMVTHPNIFEVVFPQEGTRCCKCILPLVELQFCCYVNVGPKVKIEVLQILVGGAM